MIKLLDILKESLLAEYNKSQLDYISSKLGIERNSEFDSLMNALDAQGLKYPELKDKITKGEIKSFNDLKALKIQSKSAEKKSIGEDAEKIFEDDNFLVVVPLTHKASCKYGAGTKWCTTEKDPYHWDEYTDDQQMTLYYILNKTLSQSNPFYKVAILINRNNNINSVFDAEDNNISNKNKNILDIINYLKSKGVEFKSKSKEFLSKKSQKFKEYIQQYIKNGGKGNLELPDNVINSLPDNLTFVGGNLELYGNNITSLPDNLKTIKGKLWADKLKSLPDNLTINGSLFMAGCPIKILPETLKVGQDIVLVQSKITKLPDNFIVNGFLKLDDSPITSLPNNLKVNKYLDISGCPISSLPNDIKVKENVYIDNTPLAKLYSTQKLKKMYPGVEGKFIK
jgi:hypothetical protein